MSTMFDPYFKWLGISPKDQPPHHYRLLGIDPFVADPDVIENAADRQMMLVRTFQTGDRAALSQRILNEIAAAKVCLLNPTAKAAYDRGLRAKLNTAEVQLAGPSQPPTRPTPRAAPTAHTPAPASTSMAPTVPTQPRPVPAPLAPGPAAPPPQREHSTVPTRIAVPPPRATRHRAAAKRPVWIVAVACGGAIAGVTLFALLKIGPLLFETDNPAQIAAIDAASPNIDRDSSADQHSDPTPAAWIDWVKHGPYPWIVTDGGKLIEVPDALRPNSWLLSSQTFADFSLTGQYKVEPQGEGGIYVRVPSDAEHPWLQGIEVHFKDDWGQPPKQDGTGAVWKKAAPLKNKARPAGQWNDFHIECRGRRLNVSINNEQVMNYDMATGVSTSGHLGLDGVHGGIAYRNLQLVPSENR
jgi:hypothetical protein